MRKGFSINMYPPYQVLKNQNSIITDFIEIPQGATKLYYNNFEMIPCFRFSLDRKDESESTVTSSTSTSGTIYLNEVNPKGYPYLIAQIYTGEKYMSADISNVEISFDVDRGNLKKVSDPIEIISNITFVDLFDKDNLRKGVAIDANFPYSIVVPNFNQVFLTTEFIKIPEQTTTLKFSGLTTYGNYLRCRLSKTSEDFSESVIFPINSENGTIDLSIFAQTYSYFCATVYRASSMASKEELKAIGLRFNFVNIGEEINNLKKSYESIWENIHKVPQSLSDVIVDLPISDGDEIDKHYAYIEQSTGYIKVKL